VVECQDHLISLARAHVERHVFEAFAEPVAAASTPGLSEILRTTSALYALSCLERDRAWFLEAGYFEPVKARALRSQVGALSAEIREHAALLVGGFGIPLEVLPEIGQG
jgi:acyl-CoA oxidase